MMPGRILAGLFAVWLVAAVAAFSTKAATSEQIVRDPLSGLALYGYDPVAYFIDRAARPGDAEYEFRFAGLVWRFRSEANRKAFADYDPVAVGQGLPIEGNPVFFAVQGQQLFLFSREESLARFLENPKSLFDTANGAWPAVQRKLVP